MGFRIARKHAAKLRTAFVLFALAVPVLAVIVAGLVAGGAVAALLFAVAVLSHLAGVLIERWLFFAEARHTVMLYYGDRTA
jgi:DMSO reductase anchor subunit